MTDPTNEPTDPRDDPEEALRLLKGVLKPGPNMTVTRVEMLLDPGPRIGLPEPIPGKKRTPLVNSKLRRENLDELVKGVLHREFMLPKVLPVIAARERKAGTKAASKAQAQLVGDTLRAKVREVADRLHGECLPRALASTVTERISAGMAWGDTPPTVGNVRKIISAMEADGWQFRSQK